MSGHVMSETSETPDMSQPHQPYASTHAQATSTDPDTYTYDCTFTNNEAVADVYAHELVCKYVYA